MTDSQLSRFTWIPEIGYGKFILIRHNEMDEEGRHYFTLYAHVKSVVNKIPERSKNDINFQQWVPVSRGEKIGEVGDSGSSGLVHLHFEVNRGGYAQNKVDPYDIENTRVFYTDAVVCDNEGPNPLWTQCPPVLAPENIAPWPMFGHDPQHTWRSPFPGPETPTLKWPSPFTDGVRLLQPVTIAADGSIYVTAYIQGRLGPESPVLYALNPDHSIKWQVSLGQIGQPFSPAVDANGTIYTATNGKLYAFLPDGNPLWDPLALSPFLYNAGTPTVGDDGLIYVTLLFSGTGKKLFAVDPDASTLAERIKWAYEPPQEINGLGDTTSPTIGPDGTIYVMFLNQQDASSELTALTPFSPSGSFKWRFKVGPGQVILSSPSIAPNGDLYIGASDGNVYALKPNKELKWIRGIGGNLAFSTPAIDSDGTLYIGSSNGNLYALDSLTGQFKVGWGTPFSTGGPVDTSPAVSSNGILYFESFDGSLYAVRTNKSLVFRVTGVVCCGMQASIGLDRTIYFVGVRFSLGIDGFSPFGVLYAIGP